MPTVARYGNLEEGEKNEGAQAELAQPMTGKHACRESGSPEMPAFSYANYTRKEACRW